MILKINPKRTVEVIDIVDSDILGEAQKLSNFAADSKDPIYVLLNSPGGIIIFGQSFIDAMEQARAKGIEITCVTGVLAASMAFNMLAHCDNRYALRHSKLLFHPARIGSREPLSADMLMEAYKDLVRIEKYSIPEIQQMMGMSDEQFIYHYKRETMWDAEQLIDASPKPWLKLVDDVEGTKKLFTISRPRPFFLFGQLFSIKPYALIHIMRNFDHQLLGH